MAALRGHRLEGGKRSLHVGVVVAGWIAHRFGNDETGCKVHHRRRAAFADRAAHRLNITDVPFDEGGSQRSLAVPGGQIVENDHVVAG